MQKLYIFKNEDLHSLTSTHDFRQIMIYTADGLVTIPDTYIDKAGTMILKKFDNFLHAHKHEACWSLT